MAGVLQPSTSLANTLSKATSGGNKAPAVLQEQRVAEDEAAPAGRAATDERPKVQPGRQSGDGVTQPVGQCSQGPAG